MGLALAAGLLLTGCFDGGDSGSGDQINEQLFPADGKLSATIRRTDGGVPHITASNLSSAAFGHGYAQAQDNVCLLAEAFVKARSERSKYFGAGPKDINIISDFSYKAQGIHSGAGQQFEELTPETRALVEGFTEGYNRYVVETDPADLPAQCRNAEWVKEITPADLIAYYRIVGQYASGALFATGAVFGAVPPHMSPAPTPADGVATTDELKNLQKQVVATAEKQSRADRNFLNTGLASNAWAIGKTMTEQGRGALMSNPHFPFTGHRRLYEVQMTVPGYLNVHGAGLLGTAIPLINFNENLGWSHTNSASRRFTWYELTLKEGDALTYIKDGEERPVTSETFQIEVAMPGVPEPVVLEREFYFSEYGPMLALHEGENPLPAWGDPSPVSQAPVAYTYRDANADSSDLLDTWLKMSRASNLDEFQSVFEECGTTLWVNVTYADDQGNAFFIDSSSVPNLSDKSIALINFKRQASPEYAELFNAGVTLLDGSTSEDDWIEGSCNGLVPYEHKPKLVRTDWVQNSNSSHWATNPDEFLTGYSPLFGPEKAELNPRTRLGLKMLQNPMEPGMPDAPLPAGQDGKFNAKELLGVVWNNRALYAEQFLPELRQRCTAIGASPVAGLDLTAWCDALHSWDGLYNIDSVGAHVFRVFMANYRTQFATDLTVDFRPDDPVGTPSTPSEVGAGTEQDTMLQALAAGVAILEAQGIQPTAELGSLQYYRPSGGAKPGTDEVAVFLTDPIPWHGGNGDVDGAFNDIQAMDAAEGAVAEDTRFPIIASTTIDNTAGLSDGSNGVDGWMVLRGTTWHFGLEFTDNGPEAYGLMSYSQSTDPMSPYFVDQSIQYSNKEPRKLFFTEEDIAANVLPQGEVTVSQ